MVCYKVISNSILISIKVIPGSSKNEIVGIEGDNIKIRINAAADKGKANDELIWFLSKQIGVSQSEIKILRGEKSRSKQVLIESSKEKILKFLQSIEGADPFF